MTDISTLIAEVLRLDGEATPGPWRATQGEQVDILPTGLQRGCEDCCRPARVSADDGLVVLYRTAAPLLAAEVQRLRGALLDMEDEQECLADEITTLRAALEEQRLVLTAEQGRQEGAPSSGWEYGGQIWYRGRRRCKTCREGWEWWIRNHDGTVVAEGRAPSARAAMQAADAAQEPR